MQLSVPLGYCIGAFILHQTSFVGKMYCGCLHALFMYWLLLMHACQMRQSQVAISVLANVQQVPVSAEAMSEPAATTQRKSKKANRMAPPHVPAEVKQAVARFVYVFDPALIPRVSIFFISLSLVAEGFCLVNDMDCTTNLCGLLMFVFVFFINARQLFGCND